MASVPLYKSQLVHPSLIGVRVRVETALDSGLMLIKIAMIVEEKSVSCARCVVHVTYLTRLIAYILNVGISYTYEMVV